MSEYRTTSALARRASALLLLLAACGGGEVEQPVAEVARPVKTMVIGGDLRTAGPSSLPGQVEAADEVDLAFRVGGPLIELTAKEGDLVKKGQRLARIDPRDFEIQRRAAQARFEEADADFRRLANLYEKDAISEAQLDQARAARDVARAAIDDARANLADTRLKAPFAGIIGERQADNFQDVRPKQPILTLVRLDEVNVVVDVPESIAAHLTPGGAATATFVAQFATAPGREFPLRVHERATQADSRTQTYRITLRMQQPEGVTILPGMTATVVGRNMQSSATEISVPAVAVWADDASVSHVWVVEASKVASRKVTTGPLTGSDAILIEDGLAAGDVVAVSAVSRLRDGMEVRPYGD